MKYNYFSSYFSFFYIFIFISKLNACDVMGSRACGQKPEKDDKESDPVKYCVASRVYFECVHKKYRGCENKEKYEMAMESMMKGLRKRVDELLAFCSDKIEDYKFNIIWESPKQAVAADSVRNGGSGVSSKNGILGSAAAPSNDLCQIKTINDLCQPLAMTAKFNPSWNSANKRSWCQRSTTYYRCLKSRLDKCLQQDIQNHFELRERYLYSQINLYCPGGVYGCPRGSTDPRCYIGTSSSSSTFCLPCFFVQMVLQILLMFSSFLFI